MPARGRPAVVIAIALGATAAARGARADLPPISSSDYAIDLYSGAALGSTRIVGMGGAATASAEGSAGTVVNPAAAAVRSATSTSRFDWDWHLDGQQAIVASDLDNNGRDRGGGARLATFGLALDWREWAVAAVVTQQATQIDGATMLDAQASRGRFALARSFAGEQLTVGLSLDVGTLDVAHVQSGLADVKLFEKTGSGLAAGAVWQEPRGAWRAGVAASAPVSGNRTSIACGQGGAACPIAFPPDRVEVPWQLGVGVARRWGEAAWNQPIAGDFRDEHALLVAADVIVTGGVDGGLGLEAFGEGLAQPSGRHPVVSVRAGAEWELVPGHLRVRGGSYWEPGRFDGVGGRPHATFGLEGGAFEVRLWGRHRLRASVTGDVAPRYATASLSVGFWH